MSSVDNDVSDLLRRLSRADHAAPSASSSSSQRRREPQHGAAGGRQHHEELKHFAQTTSLHGVPRVISARSVVGRVFWSTVCLAAFLMFLGNSASLLHQYRSYPKKV